MPQYCYSLISCDEPAYPSINNICTSYRHAYESRYVYIDQLPPKPNEVYLLQYNGEDVCSCELSMPKLVLTFLQACESPLVELMYKVRNCATGDTKDMLFSIAQSIGTVLRFNGDCDCWAIEDTALSYTEVADIAQTFDNCSDCQAMSADTCSFAERDLHYASFVTLPEEPEPDKGFEECCFELIVLADLADTDSYRNDFNSFWYQRQQVGHEVDFYLVRLSDATTYSLDSDTYGTFQDFGGVQPNLSFYTVQWRNVLNLLGASKYQIKATITISGISTDVFSNTYTLLPYSDREADNSIRIDAPQNGVFKQLNNINNVNFKGTSFVDCIRIRGYFGNSQAEYTQDNIIYTNYRETQVTMSVDDIYLLYTELLPRCISEHIEKFLLLSDDLKISDYNINNPSYKLKLTPVVFDSVEEKEYFNISRKAGLNYKFRNRFKNNRKSIC